MILNPDQRPAWARYAVAVLVVAAAAVIRAAFLASLGTRSPFVTFYPAVMLAALGGGLPGGILATFLATLTATFVWVEPVATFSIRDSSDWLVAGIFVVSGVTISWVTDALQRAQTRAAETEARAKLALVRAQVEEELHRYKLLAEHSRDIILYVGIDDGRILEANAAAVRAYGYTREELRSLTIHDLRAARTRGLAERQMEQADSAGMMFETVHRRKNGETFPVEVSSQGAAIGASRALISVVREITDRKRAEDALLKQQKWLQVTLTSIGDAVLATDAQGKITFLNPVAARLSSWTENEALGRPAQDVLRIVQEQTHEEAEDIIRRVLHDGCAVSMANHSALVARDGREIPIDDSAAPIKDDAGELIGVVVVFHDVTEKRRAQDALQESESQFRALANAIPQMCSMANADGEVFWYNQRWYEYTGTSPAQMEGWGWQAVHDPQTLPEVLRRWKASIATGEPFDMVFPIRGAEGVFRPFLTRIMPVRDREGKVVQWFGTNTDISEQRRTEEALRESESRMRTLGDNLPEGAIYRFRQDASGKDHVDFISAGIERLTGVPAAEFIGDAATVTRNIQPEDLTRLNAAIAESCARLTRFEVEIRHKHRVSGETRWSLLRSTPTRCPDGSTFWDGIELDITERKRAEEALRESEVRYRKLVDLAPEALVVQQDGLIVYCNAVAAQLYGALSREELLNTCMFDRVHPDELPAVLERSHQAERGARLSVRETRHLRLNGSLVEVEVTAGPVEWNGRPAILVFIRDIADRKRADQRLRESQKLESLGLLAGGVAHDFNNLLVGVIGNASLAQGMLSSGHAAAPLLASIIKAGEQAAHLTRQMLAYSGRGKFIVEALDLSALIPDISDLIRPSIPKKIELCFDLDPNLPAVEADRGQVQQVFMNLALNGAEAIGSAEGRILVRTGVKDADERYLGLLPETVGLAPGQYVWLEVSDTGCGMNDVTRARIFDPFFSTKFIGRGLGLAAVAGIVRSHKGAILVSSVPGQGSCFTVMLPAAGRSEQARAQAMAPYGAKLDGSGVILVVDDEVMVRELLKLALEHHGYSVLLADGGIAAIDAFRRYAGEISLVVLDMSMPGMSGEETLPELRRIRPKAKVLVSSGYGESEAMALFHGQHVSGFIQKPYTLDGIAQKVKSCLG